MLRMSSSRREAGNRYAARRHDRQHPDREFGRQQAHVFDPVHNLRAGALHPHDHLFLHARTRFNRRRCDQRAVQHLDVNGPLWAHKMPRDPLGRSRCAIRHGSSRMARRSVPSGSRTS